jgi:hypothetical protein
MSEDTCCVHCSDTLNRGGVLVVSDIMNHHIYMLRTEGAC